MTLCFFFFKQKTAYEIGVRLVGSEMCIRDSPVLSVEGSKLWRFQRLLQETSLGILVLHHPTPVLAHCCVKHVRPPIMSRFRLTGILQSVDDLRRRPPASAEDLTPNPPINPVGIR